MVNDEVDKDSRGANNQEYDKFALNQARAPGNSGTVALYFAAREST
jgi:hypothetical protein